MAMGGLGGELVVFGEWREERREVRLFQRVRAASSAAWTDSVGVRVESGGGLVVGREFAAKSAFCSFMRVLSKASKVER